MKLESALPEWRFIHTHFGFGYRFSAEPSQDFHRRPQLGNRLPARPCQPRTSMTTRQGDTVKQESLARCRRVRRARALGAAACGSSNNDNELELLRRLDLEREEGERHRQRRRLDLRRSRLPAVGLEPQGPGHHAELPARSARAPASPQLAAGTVDFARLRSAADAATTARRSRRARPSRSPSSSGPSRSPTTSRASTTGLKLDGATTADIFLGQDHELERPDDRGAQPGGEPAGRQDHGRPPLGRVGHDEGLHDLPRRLQPDWKSEVGVDKTVKWPTGTGAKGNDGVAAAVKQTDGAVGYVEQAYALQNNFTTAA